MHVQNVRGARKTQAQTVQTITCALPKLNTKAPYILNSNPNYFFLCGTVAHDIATIVVVNIIFVLVVIVTIVVVRCSLSHSDCHC